MIEKIKPYFDEIVTDLKENGSEIYFPEFVDKPTGTRQDYDGNTELFDHIYVDQHVGYCGDDYYGHIYYPFEGKYIKVGYNC